MSFTIISKFRFCLVNIGRCFVLAFLPLCILSMCCLSTAVFMNRLLHSSHVAAESPCNDWCCLHACFVRNRRSHSEHWYSTRVSTKATQCLETPSIQNYNVRLLAIENESSTQNAWSCTTTFLRDVLNLSIWIRRTS